MYKRQGEITVDEELITNKDMTNSYKEGIKKELLPNEEFVNVVPIDFKINGKTIMKDPKGFPGQKLMGRAMMVTAPKKNVYSVASIIESLGIELVDISVGSIVDINCFKNDEISDGIGLALNIGAQTSVVTLYSKGIPIRTKVLGTGGKEIDRDLSYMYRIDIKEAKNLKEKFALAHKRNANANEVYETVNVQGEKIKINQLEASEVVMSRINDILSLIKNEINDLTNKPIQYIIVTGGVSNMQDIEYCLHDSLSMSASKGNVKLIGVRNNKYSTVIGNIIYFLNTLKLKGLDYSMLSEDDMDMLSSPDKQFLNTSNETMLGKVFSYFFGE